MGDPASTLSPMTADRAMIAAIADLSAALRYLGEPAMVIGGMAVLARGIVRQTVDVDATIWSEHLDLDRLFAVLARHGITARIPDARKFAAERQVLLLKHETTSTPLEEPERVPAFDALVQRALAS